MFPGSGWRVMASKHEHDWKIYYDERQRERVRNRDRQTHINKKPERDGDEDWGSEWRIKYNLALSCFIFVRSVKCSLGLALVLVGAITIRINKLVLTSTSNSKGKSRFEG